MTERTPDVWRLSLVEAIHPRYWLTWLGLSTWRTMSMLPLPVLHAIGLALGEVLYWLTPSRRNVAATNLLRCFPELDDAERKAMVRRCFHRTGQSVFDVGVGVWANRARLDRLVDVEGVENLDSVAAAGQQAILLAPHFVALSVAASYWSRRAPVFAMYKRPRNDLFHMAYRRATTCETTGIGALDFIMGIDRDLPLNLVEHRAGLKPAIRRLRAGEQFYYLPDQDLGSRQAVFAPFFGIQTSTIAAGSRFAALGRARLVPCITLQKPRGAGYRLIFLPPLEDWPGDDLVDDATRMNETIEALVRQYPDQYFWLHKRFKTRPDGEARFYE